MSFSECQSRDILDEISDADIAADNVVASISSAEELSAKQKQWRTDWIANIGGLPERTPLNAQEGPVVKCDGFTLQNVLFESMPGVYIVGHLFLPDKPEFKAPYPVLMMPMGHSDTGVIAPRYARHMAMTARAGLAAFAWDPYSQGERRQCEAKFDASFAECASEHTRLGVRGWLVGWNFMRFRIWDAVRAVDYVETRKDLDCSKLGVAGTSGGGTMSTYMQALDDRIKVAFPNCYVSSFRAVFKERGCHDSEQFFWNQLNTGVNHAAMLAMGQPRVALATGSRWKDYFPHYGAEETFKVFTTLTSKLNFPGPYWHFHCDGPHGLPAPTRAAQVDWMRYCILGAEPPKSLEEYWSITSGDHQQSDPANNEPLPFNADDTFFSPTHFVRDLPGFKSLYTVIAERAEELAKTRVNHPKSRDEFREIVRRRAGIRPLAELEGQEPSQPFDHSFDWWYLRGPYGKKRENEAAIMSTLGKSVVGRDAENIIIAAIREIKTNGGKPVVLKAHGYDCIAAAHAYAAEPQLFSSVEFTEPPPSWTDMIKNPDPSNDSYAISVWGALEEYDWPELI